MYMYFFILYVTMSCSYTQKYTAPDKCQKVIPVLLFFVILMSTSFANISIDYRVEVYNNL